MKNYTKPEISVTTISNADVITLSTGGVVVSKFDDNKTGKGFTEVPF